MYVIGSAVTIAIRNIRMCMCVCWGAPCWFLNDIDWWGHMLMGRQAPTPHSGARGNVNVCVWFNWSSLL